jgi:hypothetical protein
VRRSVSHAPQDLPIMEVAIRTRAAAIVLDTEPDGTNGSDGS